MAVEVIRQPQSLEDISNIAEFISKESAYYAAIQSEKFFAKASILETFPLAGRVVPELGVDDLREIIGPYRLIYYVVSDSRVEVLTIHHSNMLLSNNQLF